MKPSLREAEMKMWLTTTDLAMKEIAYRMGLDIDSARAIANRVYVKEGVKNGRISLLLREIETLKACNG
jgi:DNA-binding CsgD family transcriptional regulator